MTFSVSGRCPDTGMFGVYAGCLPKKVDDVLAICRDQVALVAEHGITCDELLRGQGQMRGGLVLGLEDTGSRMSRLGKAELLHGELPPVGELLDRISGVTLEDVQQVATDLLATRPTLAVIGPFDADRDFARAVA